MVKSFTSLALASILVFGNLWIPVYTHTCKLFNRSEVSFFNAKFCCEDDTEEAQTLLDFGCCSLDLKTIKSVEHSDSPSIYKVFSAVFTLPEFFTFQDRLISTPISPDVVARPPPATFYNRTLLSFIQVFRL